MKSYWTAVKCDAESKRLCAHCDSTSACLMMSMQMEEPVWQMGGLVFGAGESLSSERVCQ